MTNHIDTVKSAYKGPERRKTARRSGNDRRAQARTESNRASRRQGRGRRASD